MTSDSKVLLCTQWHSTSAKGNVYLSGFLGKAQLVGFKGEPAPDGSPTWNIFLSPGKQQRERADNPSAPRQRPAASSPAGDPRPFDDSVEDVGR